MTAAVPLVPWFPGADSVDPSAAAANELLVVEDEPLSAGEPPVTPSLVSELEVSYPASVVRTVCGASVSWALTLSRRPEVVVRWDALSIDRRDEVLGFLRDECEGGRFSFTLRPDGPDGDAVIVRSVEPPRSQWETKNVYSVTQRCEAVFRSP